MSLKQIAYHARCSQGVVHAPTCPYLNRLIVLSQELKKQELKLLRQQTSTFSFHLYSPGKKFDNPFLHTEEPVIKWQSHKSGP